MVSPAAIHATPTSKGDGDSCDWNRAVESIKDAIKRNGATPELSAHFNEIGELLRKADRNTIKDTYANNKSNRHDRVATVASHIAPRLKGDNQKWKEHGKSVTRQTAYDDARYLQQLLAAITGCDSNRAANAIIHLLNRPENSQIKAAVIEAFYPSDYDQSKVKELILGGIKDAIAHHTNE